ncbi:MAG TPA: hypothetical protein VKY38_02080 [Azoarcus sp.]|nr:hypothetical protein [Azoarcus sp.]
MIALRIVVLAAVLAIGGALLAWLLTGNPKYRQLAWNLFIGALLIIFMVLLAFVAARLTE